jgi:hypothetical protein
MRFAGTRAENFLGKKPRYDALANSAQRSASDERQANISAEAQIEAAKLGLAGDRAAASASQFGGIMSGLSSGIAGGLGALGKTNVGTTRRKTQFSQPHASGIGREALGGYDL